MHTKIPKMVRYIFFWVYVFLHLFLLHYSCLYLISSLFSYFLNNKYVKSVGGLSIVISKCDTFVVCGGGGGGCNAISCSIHLDQDVPKLSFIISISNLLPHSTPGRLVYTMLYSVFDLIIELYFINIKPLYQKLKQYKHVKTFCCGGKELISFLMETRKIMVQNTC